MTSWRIRSDTTSRGLRPNLCVRWVPWLEALPRYIRMIPLSFVVGLLYLRDTKELLDWQTAIQERCTDSQETTARKDLMVAEITPLRQLFVVRLSGPHSSGFIVLRARNEDHAREIAKDSSIVMPAECEITDVLDVADPGQFGPLYSFFEYGPVDAPTSQ